jgi:undecaprenyl-diphosphatase
VVEFGIKNLIKRPRPEFTLPNVHVVGDPLTTYSFPSTHATFAFASAFVLSQSFPKYKKIWYSLAVLIAFSRIYLEKHYPLDVVGGAVVGTVIGWGCVKIVEKISN